MVVAAKMCAMLTSALFEVGDSKIVSCMSKWEGWPLGHTYNMAKALHVDFVAGGWSLGRTYDI